jgi:hypothetical protein
MFRNNADVQHIHMRPNKSIGASFDGSFANTRTEGTGTRPDYLANCADKKIEGPLQEKRLNEKADNSRNSCRFSGGEVGAKGTVKNLPNCSST